MWVLFIINHVSIHKIVVMHIHWICVRLDLAVAGTSVHLVCTIIDIPLAPNPTVVRLGVTNSHPSKIQACPIGLLGLTLTTGTPAHCSCASYSAQDWNIHIGRPNKELAANGKSRQAELAILNYLSQKGKHNMWLWSQTPRGHQAVLAGVDLWLKCFREKSRVYIFDDDGIVDRLQRYIWILEARWPQGYTLRVPESGGRHLEGTATTWRVTTIDFSGVCQYSPLCCSASPNGTNLTPHIAPVKSF